MVNGSVPPLAMVAASARAVPDALLPPRLAAPLFLPAETLPASIILGFVVAPSSWEQSRTYLALLGKVQMLNFWGPNQHFRALG